MRAVDDVYVVVTRSRADLLVELRTGACVCHVIVGSSSVVLCCVSLHTGCTCGLLLQPCIMLTAQHPNVGYRAEQLDS
jgi:hypothetical protein